MKFYSEHGEDKWIHKNLLLPNYGFYVDIGAAHPTRMSNTAFLRDRGWDGLQIDADPFWKKYWDKIRKELIVAVISDGKPLNFSCNKRAHRLSSISPSGEMAPSHCINDILEEHRVEDIYYMSLDVEGHEYEVFRSLAPKYYPKILVSEYDTLGKKDYRLWSYLTRKSPFMKFHETQNNLIFVRT